MDGRYFSPFTCETYAWAEDVDNEHIVARIEAHDSGLCAADTFTRLAFASAPLNLAFAPPALNRDEKGSKDVAEGLPELNRCWYVNWVVAVKRRFGLSMDAREAQAALAVLESCPSVALEVVADEGAEPAAVEVARPTPAAADTPTPEAVQEEDPLALYDDNSNGRNTCAEARRHGIAPVHSDHPAYAYKRDGDGDGVVCE